MCWSMEASVVMTGVGSAAALVSLHRKDPTAIGLTLGYFAAMEALQVAGYAVLDQCGTKTNEAVTLASYLHIAFQPFFINAFAMELVPRPVKQRAKTWVYAICALSTFLMLVQLIPWQFAGTCKPGAPLCANTLCTVSGNWHIAWNIPYNGLLLPLENLFGVYAGFPTYMIAAFVLPLAFGAWRFVAMHLLFGPVLAWSLTKNPNEMPAVWCLFSIFILVVGLSLRARGAISATDWWGRDTTKVT
ncbi:DUF5765 domain-containing protein [Pseudorhodobacter sp. W20_MBD10_FR17]|uniref:DUF5765 domain-containing protein n=1 Tax=Pseudorhodobacter sp. W20_MBD10_FR17 TaxID=3240266 RepID=UPI003F951B45